jgi:hypothetical protein
MTRKIAIIGAGSPSLSTALLAGAIWPLVASGEHEYAARTLAAACGIRRPPERTAHRCGLPGCEATTTHNGGYCCADHCREHRQRQRTANAARQVSTRSGDNLRAEVG